MRDEWKNEEVESGLRQQNCGEQLEHGDEGVRPGLIISVGGLGGDVQAS